MEQEAAVPNCLHPNRTLTPTSKQCASRDSWGSASIGPRALNKVAAGWGVWVEAEPALVLGAAASVLCLAFPSILLLQRHSRSLPSPFPAQCRHIIRGGRQ